MSAQRALRAALREHLGPVARRHGYRGSAPLWRKSSASGDWAVVSVQSSRYSTAADLQFVVNLAFAPEPWLRWQAETLGAGMPKSVDESVGLYRERLHPEGSPDGADVWWEVWDDASAHRAVADVLTQLDTSGWPDLDAMFDRDVLLARVREGVGTRLLGDSGSAQAEAVLLMDSGPSDALNAALDRFFQDVQPVQRHHAEWFAAWVREQSTTA